MALHVVDISPSTIRDVEDLCRVGRYESVEQFLALAIRNQVLLEKQRSTSGDEGRPDEPRGWHQPPSERQVDTEAGLGTAAVDRSAVEPDLLRARRGLGRPAEVLTARPTLGPLFGQYYRFLPLKLVTRLLAYECQTELPELAPFAQRAVGQAFAFAQRLQKVAGAAKSSLSTGFPTRVRDEARSRIRFEYQYVGRRRADGRLDGFGTDMGLFDIKVNGKTARIGLSEGGYEFACLSNPLLDENGTLPLSDEEVRFLLARIRDHLPDEHRHMVEILRAVRHGCTTPASLAYDLGKFYAGRFGGQWTEAKINLTRSGGVSRLLEMRVLGSKKEGVRVVYSVDEGAAQAISDGGQA